MIKKAGKFVFRRITDLVPLAAALAKEDAPFAVEEESDTFKSLRKNFFDNKQSKSPPRFFDGLRL